MKLLHDSFVLHKNECARSTTFDLNSVEYIHIFKSTAFPPQEIGSYNYLIHDILKRRKNRDLIICLYDEKENQDINSCDFPIFALKLKWSTIHKFLFKKKSILLKFYNRRIPVFYKGILNILKEKENVNFLVWSSLESCRYLRNVFPNSYICFSQRKFNFQSHPEHLYNSCNTVIYQASSQLKEAIKICYRLTPTPYIIPNGVDTLKYSKIEDSICNDFKKQLRIPSNKFLIIFPSKLTHYKGINWLSHIIQQSLKVNPDLFFIIPGYLSSEISKNMYPELYSILDKKESILFLNGSKKSDMVQLYSISHLCIMTNSEKEGFSMASIEAMACGLPVICPPFGTFVDYVKPNYNGFFYSLDNPIGSGVNYIQKLYHDRKLLSKLSANCVKFISHSLRREKLINNYNYLLNHEFEKIDSSISIVD